MIRISFSDKTVRVAVEINGAIESAITELPQRTWVGLTGQEINHIFAANVGYPERMMDEVAKLLKEKNNE